MKPVTNRRRPGRRDIAGVLRSAAGAFDLPSILVGVVVVGVLSAGVLASIFSVIPFAQDGGARQDLAALTTAEGVAKARDARFAPFAGLTASGYLSSTPATLAAGTDAAGSCFVGVAKSGSGKVYLSSSTATTTVELTPTTPIGCITREQLQGLVAAVGGFSGGSAVDTGPVFDTVTWTKGSYGGPDGLDSVAASADGRKVFGADFGRYLYVSSDSGATMIEQSSLGAANWNAVSASPDGTRLIAIAWNGAGNVMASSSDGGASWSTSDTIPGSDDRQWRTVAMSADGTRLVAGSLGGSAFTSSDSGATWTRQSALGTHYWSSASMSGDGTRISLVADNKLITSTNSGSTWSQKDLPAYIGRLTRSADGTKLVATRYDGTDSFIWISSDSGTTWTPRDGLGPEDIAAMAGSADGNRVVAVAGPRVYTSGDAGATWTAQPGLTGSAWTTAASSSDGSALFVGGNSGVVFTGTWGP